MHIYGYFLHTAIPEHFVQVLEKWEGDGHLPNRGGVGRDLTKRREKQEDQWMLKLRTLYPYGLNDSLNGPIKGVPDHIVGLNFPSLSRKYSRPTHRDFNKTSINKENSQTFIKKLRHILQHKIDQAARFIGSSKNSKEP